MKNGIRHMTGLRIEHTAGELVKISMDLTASPRYDPHHLIYEPWAELFPGDVIVKCEYCGQHGARKTECKHCGHSID